jgi:hypothetical protein
MNKLLIVALLAAAGVLAWLSLSKPEVEAPEPLKVPTSTPGVKPATANAAASTPPGASSGAAPVVAQRPAGLPPPTVVPAATPLTPPGPTPLAGDPTKPSPWGRDPAKGMVEAPTASVKATVRRYWGNLPKSGVVPARITLDELMPPEVIAALNVPPQSVVTMLGDYAVTDPQSFKSVLERPDDMQTLTGISVVTPDGKLIRDYVRLNPPAKAP